MIDLRKEKNKLECNQSLTDNSNPWLIEGLTGSERRGSEAGEVR
jgi:hypothetical protein